MDCDIIVIGAGPAGLAFARRLAGSGLRIVVIERHSLETLADPASDGRAIALTHRSIDSLRALGVWEAIDPAGISTLRSAEVLNGASPFTLSFEADAARSDYLGKLVSNHLIRRALFAATSVQQGLTILADAQAKTIATGAAGGTVTLNDGRVLRGRLVVGADSRFSNVRAQLDIPAEVRRLGRSMLLADVDHDRDHRGIATEWFAYDQTMALLPLNGRRSSVVLTLPEDAITRMALLDASALSAELTRRSEARLGAMRMVAGPHVYPLATTWARHFAATRAALIGDAAVGMHPVTAHGFNLGLRGAVALADLVAQAARKKADIGRSSLLRRYEMEHRLAAAPLFAATGTIVRVFTNDGLSARLARPALLRAAERLTPIRKGVSRMLMQR